MAARGWMQNSSRQQTTARKWGHQQQHHNRQQMAPREFQFSHKAITDLNGDCMRRVFFYLRLLDRLKFALACNSFDDSLASCLRKDVVIMRECIQTFTLQEMEQLLQRFGQYIRRLSLRQTIDASNIEYYKLISRYCEHVEAVELQRNPNPFADELIVYRDILCSSTELQTVQVFQCRTLEREFMDRDEIVLYHLFGCALCVIISDLKEMKTLHYSDFSLLGSDLSLTNVTDLNIAYCNNFNPDDFMRICHTVNLHTLNINNCTRLNSYALEALVETQTELSHLTISNNLMANNYEVLGRLKSLRHLIIFDKDSQKLCELMQELSDHHRDDLETLKISSNSIMFDTKFRQNLLSFRNLKVYYPSNVVAPDDEYLLEIGKCFPQLKKLKICICVLNTAKGFADMLRHLRHLSELILDSSKSEENYKFDLDILRPIVEVRRQLNCGLLTLHVLTGTVAQNVYRSPLYRNNMDIVIVKRHKPQYIHRI